MAKAKATTIEVDPPQHTSQVKSATLVRDLTKVSVREVENALQRPQNAMAAKKKAFTEMLVLIAKGKIDLNREVEAKVLNQMQTTKIDTKVEIANQKAKEIRIRFKLGIQNQITTCTQTSFK